METFCGECFSCKRGYVDNCTDENGGWALGCRMDGGQVLIIGAGPTGICTLLCVILKNPKKIIVCETDDNRIAFINEHYPNILSQADQ